MSGSGVELPPRPGARLLVVDDIQDNRELLVRRLQRLGHHDIATAADGLEACGLLAAGSFDAVLLDVMMPRMNGVEVLERMRAERLLEETPVIMVSAATEQEIVVRCIELGAEDYLDKPINPVLLRARLGSVLEKRALRAAVRAQLAALENELAQARAQQLSMVPTVFPGAAPGQRVSVHAALHPARQVGGDLYDCFELAPDRWCVAVGDVSGKGMPAALFMARARSALRATALQIAALTGRVPGPAEVADWVNRELCRNNPGCMFITLFLGVIDVPGGQLDFVNAGHVRPYWLTAGGDVREIACPPGPPLGIMDDARQPTNSVTLGPGDGLVVITDGLADMTNAEDAFYSQARIMADLRELCRAGPEALITELCARVLRFAGTAAPADDVTALALRLRW
jgi:serine phosphatase RsbU (regulator of sigma subunit)